MRGDDARGNLVVEQRQGPAVAVRIEIRHVLGAVRPDQSGQAAAALGLAAHQQQRQ